jgi:hypothetical protein
MRSYRNQSWLVKHEVLRQQDYASAGPRPAYTADVRGS